MATLTAPTEVRDAAPPPPGRLLRVSRHGQPERTFELNDGKCTIGSSPRCQVCLPASDARPMQCLLTLEADAATVTRWAAGVLLNGHEFATATLAAGDRLTVGPWEIALTQHQVAPASPGEAPSSAGRPVEKLTEPLPQSHPESAPQAEPLTAAPEASSAEVGAPRAAISRAPASLPAPSKSEQLPRAVEPETVVGASQLRQVEEALAELIAEASAPSLSEPVGTKTIHMASRKTSPVILPTPPRPSTAASQTYADRLLLHLWTANHQARSRCAALLDATRASRSQAATAVANQAAAANDLAQARADHDAETAASTAWLASLQAELADRTAEQQRLQLELAAHAERQAAGDEAAERLSELANELAAAEQSVAQLRAELAERDQRLQELAGAQATADEARTELEVRLQQEHEHAGQLQGEIDRLQAVIQRLDAEHSTALQAAHAERDELRDALATLEAIVARQAPAPEPEHKAPAECSETFTEPCSEELTEGAVEGSVEQFAPQPWPAQPETTHEAPACAQWDSTTDTAPAGDAADWFSRWQLQPVESDLEASADDSQGAMPADLGSPAAAEPEVTYVEPEQTAVEPEYATESAAYDELAPEADSPERAPLGFLEALIEEAPPAPQLDEQVEVSTPAPSRSYGEELTPGLRAESPEPGYTTPSFIDRYRGLMEDDAESNLLRASSPARALLDEEHLSPAQARTGDDPEDDADEALEAYMSNLMRRVRGDAAPGASAGMTARSTSLAPGLVAHEVSAAVAVEPTEPQEPLDLEGLKARRRQTSRPLDLAALREIANDSARIAMAEHKERRHVESLMNRGILLGMTAGAAGYALYMAPGVDSTWFWAGAAAAFSAGGLGIQLLMLMRRRFALKERRLDPLANMAPPIDFSSLATAPLAPVDQPRSDA